MRFEKELESWKKVNLLNPHNLSEEEISNLPVCYATRTVILTEDNKVVLIKLTKGNFSTLVGGGIEENESLEEGMARECKEESGYDVSIISPLGYIELCRKKYKRIIFGFLVKAIGSPEAPHLTKEETELGHEVYTASLDEALKIIQQDIDNDIYYKDNFAALRSLLFLKEAQKYLES